MNPRYTLSLLALSTLASAVPALAAQVVISEFRTRGPNGGNDEFVEIHNTTASPINIGGWKLWGSNASATVSVRATVPEGVSLPPGCYYLFTNSAASGYSGAVAGDLTYSSGITDNGGITITNPQNAVIDMVGMSAGSAFKEGNVLAPMSLNQDQSYERKPGGGSGNDQDTNDNATDFFLNTVSNPSNAGSACVSATPTRPSTWGTIKSMYR